MTIAYASNQVSVSTTTNGAGAITLTFPGPTTTNNAVVVVFSLLRSIGLPAVTVTDNGGGTYVRLFAANPNSMPNFVFLATGIVGRSNLRVTITVPVAGSGLLISAWAAEFSGLLPGAVQVDVSASNSDAPTTVHDAGVVVTNYAGELLLGVFNGGSNNHGVYTTWTAGSGYTLGANFGNPAPDALFGGPGGFATIWKIGGAAGTEDPEADTDAPVSIASMSTVAITNLNIGRATVVFTPLALGITAHLGSAAAAVPFHASATVAAVTRPAAGAAGVTGVFAASAAAIRQGPVPVSAADTLVLVATAAGVRIGARVVPGTAQVLVFHAAAEAVLVPFVPATAAVGGQGEFGGYVALDGTLTLPLLLTDNGGVPLDPDLVPTYRVFGPDGLLRGVVGAGVPVDSGPIMGASNASPVAYTSPNHGLTDGTCVTAAGVRGNLGANATGPVQVIDADTFAIPTAVGSGDYTGGGAWHVTGLYLLTPAASAAAGFEVAGSYVLRDRFVSVGRGLPGARTLIVT